MGHYPVGTGAERILPVNVLLFEQELSPPRRRATNPHHKDTFCVLLCSFVAFVHLNLGVFAVTLLILPMPG
jgi:hypothetical protein